MLATEQVHDGNLRGGAPGPFGSHSSPWWAWGQPVWIWLRAHKDRRDSMMPRLPGSPTAKPLRSCAMAARGSAERVALLVLTGSAGRDQQRRGICSVRFS